MLSRSFYNRNVLDVIPELMGCFLVRDFGNGEIRKFRITELEAYHGEEDLACHAAKGRTSRTEIMYGKEEMFICTSFMGCIGC